MGSGLHKAGVVGRVVLLAFFCLPSFARQRGLHFAPLMRCAGSSVVRTYLSPVGRAHHDNLYLQHLRARTSASIMGSELQPPALRSTPPRCPKPSSTPVPAVGA